MQWVAISLLELRVFGSQAINCSGPCFWRWRVFSIFVLGKRRNPGRLAGRGREDMPHIPLSNVLPSWAGLHIAQLTFQIRII